MHQGIGKSVMLIAIDPQILLTAHIRQSCHRGMDNAGQVPLDKARVSPRDRNFASEGQVITHRTQHYRELSPPETFCRGSCEVRLRVHSPHGFQC